MMIGRTKTCICGARGAVCGDVSSVDRGDGVLLEVGTRVLSPDVIDCSFDIALAIVLVALFCKKSILVSDARNINLEMY